MEVGREETWEIYYREHLIAIHMAIVRLSHTDTPAQIGLRPYNISHKIELISVQYSSNEQIETHIRDDIDAQIHHVGYDALFLWRYLSVLDQFVDVLLRNTVLHDDVQQNDS